MFYERNSTNLNSLIREILNNNTGSVGIFARKDSVGLFVNNNQKKKAMLAIEKKSCDRHSGNVKQLLFEIIT